MEWTDLSYSERTAKLLKGCSDVLYLCEDPYLLNLKLWPEQREIVKEFYGNDLYSNKYVEFVLVAGMGSSKTFILSVFGAIETFQFLVMDLRSKYFIHPSSPVFGLCVAGKEEQGRDTVFAQYLARIDDGPFLTAQSPQIFIDSVLWPNNFTIRLVSSKSTTEAGRRCKFILVDEADKFETTTGARSGEEVSRLLSKSTTTFKRDGHRFWAGSPLFPMSFLMKKYKQGSEIKGTLAVKKATWELNPHVTRADLDEDFQRDPLGALRDYGAEPTAGVNLYFRNTDIFHWSEEPNLLMKLMEGIPINHGPFSYILAGDPALKQDAFALALGHKEPDRIVVDGLMRFLPTAKKEIDPIEVKNFILEKVVDQLPIAEVAFDVWWFPEMQKEIQMRGVHVVNHGTNKADYDLFKGLLYDGKVDICYYSPIEAEIATLLLTPSGKIDHPRGGSKDILDALVLCVRELAERKERITPLLSYQVI